MRLNYGLGLGLLCLLISACNSEESAAGLDTLLDAATDAMPADSEVSRADAQTLDSGPSRDASIAMDSESLDATPMDSGPLPSLETPRVIDLEGQSRISIQPSVALGPDGEVGLAWCGDGDDNLGIWFSIIAWDGTIQTAPYPLDTTTAGVQNEPTVCALPAGGYAVVWSMDAQMMDADGANLYVRYRIVGADGVPLTESDVQVDSGNVGNHWLADIACDPAGGFIVVGSNSEPEHAFGVFAQRFGPDGQPRSAGIQMNATPDGSQTFPSVAIDGDGRALIAWENLINFGTPDETQRIVARWMDADESGPVSPQFEITPAADEAMRPEVSLDPETGHGMIGVILNQQEATIYTVHGETNEIQAVPTMSMGVSYNPTLASVGNDRHLAYYMTGVGSAVTARVGIVGPTGIIGEVLDLAHGALPPYSGSVDYRDGKMAIGWTERTEGNGFKIRVALIP